MEQIFKIVTIGFLSSVVQVSATAVDPSDYVLIAYSLTPAQKAQFSAVDNAASAFWETDWNGRDYIDMNTTANSYPGFDQWTGPDDAHITIKAAYNESGLYLYMQVDDNVFIDPSGTDYRTDACDLYFDALSSEQLRSASPDIMVNPTYGWALTTSSQQFQVWMGAATVPRSLMYNFYDPNLFDFIIGNKVLFDDLPTLYKGMDIEVFRMSDTRKGQEWFIPWNYIGVTGIPAGTVPAGRRIGFTGGYNDQDEAGGTEKILRWKKSDPFAATGAMDSWGDIELCTETNIIANHAIHLNKAANENTIRTEIFDLKGVKIPAGTSVAKNSLVIERRILAGGSSRSRQIRYER